MVDYHNRLKGRPPVQLELLPWRAYFANGWMGKEEPVLYFTCTVIPLFFEHIVTRQILLSKFCYEVFGIVGSKNPDGCAEGGA
jgi:hypothetical protein